MMGFASRTGVTSSRRLAISFGALWGFTFILGCSTGDDQPLGPSTVTVVEQQLDCRAGRQRDGHRHPKGQDQDGDATTLPQSCNQMRSKGKGASAVHASPTCNGVDDTATIQRALREAEDVRLPEGVCAVSGLVAERKAIKLSGRGKGRSILKYLPRTGDSAVFFSNGGGTVISDLTIDGSRGDGAQVEGVLLRPKTCLGPVVITRVEFRNVAGRALIISGSGSGNINGVMDIGDGVGADRVSIFQNDIRDSGGGIAVVTSSIPNLTRVRVHTNVVAVEQTAIELRGIHGGQVFHNDVTGGQWGVQLESGDFDLSVTGNDLRGCATHGISLGGGSLSTGSKILLAGNRVSGCGHGISIAHMTYGRFANVEVRDNELNDNHLTGVLVEAGIGIEVIRNQLRGNGQAGLMVLLAPPLANCGERCSSVDDLTITRNVFRAAGALTSAGLLLGNSEARSIHVVENDLRYDAPTPPYRPVDIQTATPPGELFFEANAGWPTATAAP